MSSPVAFESFAEMKSGINCHYQTSKLLCEACRNQVFKKISLEGMGFCEAIQRDSVRMPIRQEPEKAGRGREKP